MRVSTPLTSAFSYSASEATPIVPASSRTHQAARLGERLAVGHPVEDRAAGRRDKVVVSKKRDT